MKTYKTILLTLSIALQCSVGVSQNLVPNPSFEDTLSCPLWVGHFTVKDWVSPSWGTPDYFHTCSYGQLGVPQNVFGWQLPKTGNAYVGAHGNDCSGGNSREYIQCKLISPLLENQFYEVGFWVSRTDSSTTACNNIGAYLSVSPISLQSPENIPVLPQVVLTDSIITDNINWIQVIDTVIASGGEEYLTIGVFSNDINTNCISVPGGWNGAFHYYYDDISVKKVFSNSTISNKNLNHVLNYGPNPANSIIEIESDILLNKIELFNNMGVQLKLITLNHFNTSIETNDLISGVYFLRFTFNENIAIHKIIINH
jgi:hypothetical protein